MSDELRFAICDICGLYYQDIEKAKFAPAVTTQSEEGL
jgi:hypothetical protein